VTEAPLPIEQATGDLIVRLGRDGAAVLVAAPGAGKSTVVPIRLLDAPWLAGKIVMLEPRRVAARAVAARLAWHLGEPVGKTVGYRVRFDTQVSAATRLEVVTEGVLTRMLIDDPTLDGYGLVIFDEFHERSLPGDVGLALALETKALVRPELRILVMSATIDAAGVATLLDDAPVVEVPGRVFPVETRSRPIPAGGRFEDHVAGVIDEALRSEAGDVLVFLPGVGEINRVAKRLQGVSAAVLSLHGSMPLEDQVEALAPGSRRRVVLATSIAETSVTIPGVRIVVDGGRMRVPRFSSRTGLTRVVTTRVSRAAADQRRGRAGRTEPGVCYRLWSRADDGQLLEFTPPAIAGSDLAPVVLELAAAGVVDPTRLRWLNPPAEPAVRQATELLQLLGALTTDGRVTARGKMLARLPLHPRLAHMCLEAKAVGHGALAAALVALLGDRDIVAWTDGAPPDSDIRVRLDLLRGVTHPGVSADRRLLHRARGEEREWRRRLGVAQGSVADAEWAGQLLASAYPDRVGQRRSGAAGRFLLRNGRGASVPPSETLARLDYLVAVDLDDAGTESRIRIAAGLDAATVADLVARDGAATVRVMVDRERGQVRVTEEVKLGAIVVAERPVRDPDAELIGQGWLDAVRRNGLDWLPWSDGASRLRARLGFLRHHDPEWPDVSDSGLIGAIDTWLHPAVVGRTRLEGLDLASHLLALLSWPQREALDRLAPERFEVPTGSRIAIDYGDPAAPVLAVRLQEMFGLGESPAIAAGRIPLVLHLLSPAGRPIQVTADLPGFWRTSYFDVRREMRGRYPRHEWPEDPLRATPTRRAKRRG